MRVDPECRHCGAPVPAFGDICSKCEDGDHHNDDLAYITRRDLERLSAKADD